MQCGVELKVLKCVVIFHTDANYSEMACGTENDAC